MTTWNQALVEQADWLARVLMHGPDCTNARAGTVCCDAEKTRPLTRVERERGWTARPFYGYDPVRMCRPCAAYWHATCAANLLREQVNTETPR